MVATEIGSHWSENFPAYVYELRDPETGRPRYVGVTALRFQAQKGVLGFRLKHHLLSREATPKTRWIAGLKARGLRPTIHCLETVHHKHKYLAERRWIEYLTNRGEQLLNAECRRNDEAA